MRVHRASYEIGAIFGALTLMEDRGRRERERVFLVRCDRCGTEKEMLGSNIRRSDKSPTGGCLCVHGMAGHPAYNVWEGMVRRCENPRHESYHRYGGRGIAICSEWRESPRVFIEWLIKNGWAPGLEIDRENNDGNYTPGNCRVVTRLVNLNNTSTNRRILVRGESLTLSQAARKYGLGTTTLKYRLDAGWSVADAIGPLRR
jgi:hypothetical protein